MPWRGLVHASEVKLASSASPPAAALITIAAPLRLSTYLVLEWPTVCSRKGGAHALHSFFEYTGARENQDFPALSCGGVRVRAVEPPEVEHHCQLARIEHRQCKRSLGQRHRWDICPYDGRRRDVAGGNRPRRRETRLPRRLCGRRQDRLPDVDRQRE